MVIKCFHRQSGSRQRGQALMEMVILFPILIALTVWLFMAFRSLRSAHVAQKAAYFNLISRLDNRAMATVDGLGSAQQDRAVPPENRYFMAVEHQPSQDINQGTQAEGYLIRLGLEEFSGSNGGASTLLPGRFQTRVGVCFYAHGKCLQ